ncbi:MAG: hypothetical protein JWN30_2006 [Bacilli bacterium]|nr:hypothetical protein [Bacilli bacterium]
MCALAPIFEKGALIQAMAKFRYSNLDQVGNQRSLHDLVQWRKERRNKEKDMSYCVPQAEQVELEFLHTNRSKTSITWIGHSTFLIQLAGFTIVTDPVWANRMGLDKRLTAPGIRLSDLPDIDLVLISHGHYDHLNFSTLRKLPGRPLHLVPQGLGRLFLKKGFYDVEEFAWWQYKSVGGLQMTFVPAQHWTKRTLWDTNTSHWGGWVLTSRQETIYFAGDTGYFAGFQEIGNQFNIDYALMPIGAYEPEWFMSMQHVSPEQAVQAYLDTKARLFIPMHYGTFRLADDTPKDALERLTAEWKRLKLKEEDLKILHLGQTLIGSPDET